METYQKNTGNRIAYILINYTQYHTMSPLTPRHPWNTVSKLPKTKQKPQTLWVRYQCYYTILISMPLNRTQIRIVLFYACFGIYSDDDTNTNINPIQTSSCINKWTSKLRSHKNIYIWQTRNKKHTNAVLNYKVHSICVEYTTP